MRTLLGLVCVSAWALAGCELIVALDHDLIGGGGGQGGGVGGTGGTAPGGGGEGGMGGTPMGGGGNGGGGGECDDPGDCPVPGRPECQQATCEDSTCGVQNLPDETPCDLDATDDGVCEAGACVECIDDNQCTAPATCDTVANVCVQPHCLNLTQDEDETDIDCGGADCAPCMNSQMCVADDDCVSGFCNGTTCASCAGNDANCDANEFCNNMGVCTPDKANGVNCNNTDGQGGAECISGNCNDNGSGTTVCCATQCDGECRACSGAAGTCVNDTPGTACGAGPTCIGDDLKPQDTCNAGACVPGTAMDCPNEANCDAAADPDVCFSGACAMQSECAADAYCGVAGTTENDGMCHAKKGFGVACMDDVECTITCVAGFCT